MKSRKLILSVVTALLLVALTSILVIYKVMAQASDPAKAKPAAPQGQQKMQDMQEMMAPIQRKSRIGVTASMAFVVQQVQPGTPAEQVKLKIGDLVTQVNGEQVSSIEDFHGKISSSEPGTSVTVTYLRLDPTSNQLREHTAALKTAPLSGSVGGTGTDAASKFRKVGATQCPSGCCDFWLYGECAVTYADTGRRSCRLTSTGSCLFLFCI